MIVLDFFFQAEDGIRDLVRSRGSEMCIRDSVRVVVLLRRVGEFASVWAERGENKFEVVKLVEACLLYTSDVADERSSVDLGGRRIIKKNK